MKIPPEIAKLMDEAEQAIVPQDLRDKGWIYRDFPTRFSLEMWDLLLATMGEGNYKILVMTSGILKDGFEYKRGQFLISPQGRENMQRYADEQKAARAAAPAQ